MKIFHKQDYKLLRMREYPPLADFADAMYWAEQGDKEKLAAYLVKVDAVKQKYPKPAEL